MAATAAKTDTPAIAPKTAEAEPAKSSVPEGFRAQKLRAAQTRKVRVGDMKPVGHFSDPQQVMLSAEWDFADILKPEAWTFIAPQLQANPNASVMQDRLGTLFHVYTADHAFYAVLYVHGLRRNSQGQADALDVTCVGPVQDKDGKACAVNCRTGLPWTGRA